MCKVLYTLIFLMVNIVMAQELKLVSSSDGEHSLPAVNQYGHTSISAREVYADVTYPSGREGRSRILVAFDPLSGFYIWYFGQVGKDEARPGLLAYDLARNSIHYVVSDRLILFWGRELGFWVRESNKRSDSLRNAFDASLREIQLSLGELDKGSTGQHAHKYVEIPYRDLGMDFINPKYSAAIPRVNLIDVTRVDEKWDITVEAAAGRAQFILDKDYKVIAVQK